METLTCTTCNREWEREPKRGRKPTICPTCKDNPFLHEEQTEPRQKPKPVAPVETELVPDDRSAVLRLIVTKLRMDPDGVWRARVSLNGSTVEVERNPVWQEVHEPGHRYAHCTLWVAQELQSRLPSPERKVKR